MNFHSKRFGRAAETYSDHAQVQIKMAEMLISLLPNTISESGLNVLEMGAGTGLFSEKLLKQFLNANFSITDASEKMLIQAKAKLTGILGSHAEVGVLTQARELNLNFSVFDAAGDGRLLFKHSPFQLAASNALVQWFPDLCSHFKMVASVLNNQGMYFVSGFMQDNFPELNAILSAPPFSYMHFPGHTQNTIQMAAEAAGFRIDLFSIENIEQKYVDASDFLNAIKGLGSTRRPENTPMTRGKLQFLINEYQKKNGFEGGVKATWKPWYARLIKK